MASFVEPAPIVHPEAVVHALASTLSIPPEAGMTLLESIVFAESKFSTAARVGHRC